MGRPCQIVQGFRIKWNNEAEEIPSSPPRFKIRVWHARFIPILTLINYVELDDFFVTAPGLLRPPLQIADPARRTSLNLDFEGELSRGKKRVQSLRVTYLAVELLNIPFFFFFLFKPHVARTLIVVDRFALRMGFKGLEDLRVGNLLGIWKLDLTMLLRNES